MIISFLEWNSSGISGTSFSSTWNISRNLCARYLGQQRPIKNLHFSQLNIFSWHFMGPIIRPYATYEVNVWRPVPTTTTLNGFFCRVFLVCAVYQWWYIWGSRFRLTTFPSFIYLVHTYNNQAIGNICLMTCCGFCKIFANWQAAVVKSWAPEPDNKTCIFPA